MSEWLKVLLSLSLSGAVLILVLFLSKPLYKNRLSKKWQYYIWLIVIARMLLPFTPESSLVGNVFQKIDTEAIQTEATPQPEPNENILLQLDSPSEQRVFPAIVKNIWLIWLMVAIALFIRKITIYQSFVKYLKAGQMEISDIEIWERFGKLMVQSGVKTTVGISTNSLISSPLLIGFFQPCIMLPTTELSQSDFQHTILHELAHYKRLDMFYKWLVQLTICLHWFNPFVYLMGQEISRTCELSCDEAVIAKLNIDKHRAYGDTLLNALEIGGNYKDSLASVTLSESKDLLKERLEAIMNFKKTTRFATAISIVLICTLCFGATAVGAYAGIPSVITTPQMGNENPNMYVIDEYVMPLQPESQEEDAVDVYFNYDEIKAGTVIFIGQVDLTATKTYQLDLTADKGSGLFYGLYKRNDVTNTAQLVLDKDMVFDIRVSAVDNTIHAYFDRSDPADISSGVYYVYVGSKSDGTDLVKVQGTLTQVAN